MTAEHNHPPRCCCDDDPELGGTGPCLACPEHGELTPPIECPQCHQPIGRPHTEFCTLAPDRIWPEGPGHLVHSEAFVVPDEDPNEALCGFRSLDNTDLTCSYPPHAVHHPHSWQDGGDPRGWRNAIDPNKP